MIKKINISKCVLVLGLLMTISFSIVAQQYSNYITPVYTKVYGAQIENLVSVSDGKQLTFNEIQNNFDVNHDGFMVYYEPKNKNNSNPNTLLMSLYNGSNKILDIFYENHLTLKIRRYHNVNTNTYVDYVLFDKLYTESNHYPLYKIYFSSNFIWIEDSEYGFLTPTAHSPLFWGLDIEGNTNTQAFIQKSSNAKIRLYETFISAGYTDEDIQIYGFNTSELLTKLNTNFINSSSSTIKSAELQSNLIADFVDKDQLLFNEKKSEIVEDDIIRIAPNPVRSGSSLKIFFGKPAIEDEKIKFNLFDLMGRAVLTKEVKVNKGIHEVLLQLPASLPKGEYILNFSSANKNKVAKKIIIN